MDREVCVLLFVSCHSSSRGVISSGYMQILFFSYHFDLFAVESGSCQWFLSSIVSWTVSPDVIPMTCSQFSVGDLLTPW